VVAEIGALAEEGLAAQMNVADHGSVEAAVFRSITFTGGGLDVLVNCARVIQPSLRGDRRTNWRLQLEVNLRALLRALESLTPWGRASGPTCSTCAPPSARGGPLAAAYNASQQGLRGFSSALSLDLRLPGIRVTTVFSPPRGLSGPARDGGRGHLQGLPGGDGGRGRRHG
jgi:NAD(P)-dependent dehydrogenase (short-subunit alcohol dehydrogenase family)